MHQTKLKGTPGPSRMLPVESLSFENWWHLLARHTSVVEPRDTLRTALRIMAHRGFRHLPVIEREKESSISGIISAGDLIDIAAEGRLRWDLDTPVFRIMNRDPVTIGSKETILDAIRTISEKNIGALLIREEEMPHQRAIFPHRFSGIVTLRDIVSVMAAYAPLGFDVEDYMTCNVVKIGMQDSVASAVNLMSSERVRRLPITNSGGSNGEQVMGMITNKMILRYLESVIAYDLSDLGSSLEQPVKTMMISPMPTIDPREDCGNANYLMRELGTGGFAVVDSRGLVGLITERDLVKRVYDKNGLSFFSDLFLHNVRLTQV